MSQLKTDEDSLDWRKKTWINRKTFSVGRKQTGIHSWYSLALLLSYSLVQAGAVLLGRAPPPLGLAESPRICLFTWDSKSRLQ